MDVKPGWKSSEFFVALGAKLAALVALLYSLSGKAEQGQEVGTLVEKAVVSVGALVVIGVAAWKYVGGRTAVKVAAIENRE